MGSVPCRRPSEAHGRSRSLRQYQRTARVSQPDPSRSAPQADEQFPTHHPPMRPPVSWSLVFGRFGRRGLQPTARETSYITTSYVKSKSICEESPQLFPKPVDPAFEPTRPLSHGLTMANSTQLPWHRRIRQRLAHPSNPAGWRAVHAPERNDRGPVYLPWLNAEANCPTALRGVLQRGGHSDDDGGGEGLG
jgi:hypothetical protein